jgi:preprotein translocase subunit YajC
VPLFIVWYFLIIRPTKKQQERKNAMISALKKGDKVVTSGGIFGTVAAVEEQALLIKVAENVKIKIAKSAIAEKVGAAES